MAETFLLKNIFNPELIRYIGGMLQKGMSTFDIQAFEEEINPKLEPLALSERADLVAKVMAKQLPENFPDTARMLVNSFEPAGQHPGIVKYEEFRYMPFGIYVTEHGLDHFEESMTVLYELTKRFTSEFPIRPFIERHPALAMKRLHAWIQDPNEHVRRLVSEGTRPRLPWASRLPAFQKDPTPVLDLLDQLKEDDQRYVQRSVANNLNDIAKDHPERVVDVLLLWSSSKHSGTQWIIGHASRSLVKAGHARALKLLGFNPDAALEVNALECSDVVDFGGKLKFSFQLKNSGSSKEAVVVDYVLHFMKANGKQAPKVFKLKQLELKSGESQTIESSQDIKPISTRKYYPGAQRLEIQANGKVLATASFELVM